MVCCSSPLREERVPKPSPFVIQLAQPERETLEARSRRYTAPYREVIRAKIVLLAAQSLENKAIASRLDLPVQIVSKWRKRFFEERLPGLEERARTGRRPVFPPGAGRRGQSPRL